MGAVPFASSFCSGIGFKYRLSPRKFIAALFIKRSASEPERSYWKVRRAKSDVTRSARGVLLLLNMVNGQLSPGVGEIAYQLISLSDIPHKGVS